MEQLIPQQALAVTGKVEMVCPLRLNIVAILGGKMSRRFLFFPIVGPVYYKKRCGAVPLPQMWSVTLSVVWLGCRAKFATIRKLRTGLALLIYIARVLLLRVLRAKLMGTKAAG